MKSLGVDLSHIDGYRLPGYSLRDDIARECIYCLSLDFEFQ